jgi:hypothetical protein
MYSVAGGFWKECPKLQSRLWGLTGHFCQSGKAVSKYANLQKEKRKKPGNRCEVNIL